MVDAIIAGGGMVGGLGDRFTRVAAAHAVHNWSDCPAANREISPRHQSRLWRSGTKRLAGSDDVLAQLTGAYQRFHLPTTLAELEVDINNHAEIDKVITHTPASGGIHSLPASHADTRYVACSVRKSGIV